MTRGEFVAALQKIFPSRTWPKPLHLLQGLQKLVSASDVSVVAREIGTSPNLLRSLSSSGDPIRDILGIGLRDIDADRRRRAAQILGQLLLGRCAERAFEGIYKAEMGSHEFQLRDLRESRTDTDYRLYNGKGRPVYRINIKFHGARFRRAPELIGLNPGDCFALATYKIYSALQKQQEEQLPYFFAIVGVPELSGEGVGEEVPSSFVDTVALIHQAPKAKSKRDVEDAVIECIVEERLPVFERTFARIRDSEWYILSARRADSLLRRLLFDRVYALRIRGFAQAFKGAELDMHFSLSGDLTPLRRFLAVLREEGAHKITTLLERGDF